MRKSKERKKRTGTACIVFGLLLMAAAFFIILYNRWEAARADRAAQSVVTKMVDQIDTEEASAEMEDPDREMATMEIDGNLYIGVLEIPSLNLSLPVMADWDYEKLKISPCRYYGSYYTDDLVVAGHNYAKHFSPIKWIEPGSDVFFTNVEGEVYHYTVDNIETLQPTAVEDMIGGDWDLTLFTCTTGGRSRCTVRCVRNTE